MSAPFNAAAWVTAWEANGGGWSVINNRLAFILPGDAHDQVAPMMGQITGCPDRLAAVRQHILTRH